MREFSKTKPVKFSLTLLLIAALFIAALSPLAFIDNTASAEAWASNTQYTYALGFSSPQPNTITTVVSQSGTTYDTGIPASLGAILPNEEGYEFVGFEINGKSVASYNDETSTLTVLDDSLFFAEGTVELTPKFQAIVYTITYNSGVTDGSVTMPANETYSVLQNGNEYPLPAPTRTGYTFAGWELNGEKIARIDSTVLAQVAGTNIDLTATWTTTTYDLVVSINGTNSTYPAAAQTYIGVYMGSFTKPAAPEGMEFKGWQVNGEFVDIATYQMPASSVTVVAVFGAPEVIIPVDVVMEKLDGTYADPKAESVSVTAGSYTPSQLAASITAPTGYIRKSVVWADDGTTGVREIDGTASYRIKCTYNLIEYTITIHYYYDLNGDGTPDDINGDGDPDQVATTYHNSDPVKYGQTYSVTSPTVKGLTAINAAVSGVAENNVIAQVLYTAAPDKRTAQVGGIGGTVQNNEGGVLDTAVSVTWDTAAASAHSAVAASTDREVYGVLCIDMIEAENAMFGVRGVYTITVNLGESMSEIGNYMVYKINEDGSYSPVQVRMDGSSLQLTVDAGGDYLVTGVPNAQDPTLFWVVIALLILIIILIIVLLLILLLVTKKSVTLVTGVEGSEDIVIKGKKGSVIELPTPEEREGFIFAGWYLDEECTQPVPLEPEEDNNSDDTPGGDNPDGGNPDDTPGGAPEGGAPEGESAAAFAGADHIQNVFFQIMTSFFQQFFILAGYMHCRQVLRRRISHHLPVGGFLLIKHLIILSCRGFDGIMARIICLDHRLAGSLAPAGPSCRLGQELECSFPGAVIIRIKRHIRGQHPYQCHIREIMPFHDHLRPHKDICLFIGKCGEDLLMGVFLSGRIHIHPQHT